MRAGITADEWRNRAKKLNLEWVDGTPTRNDEHKLIRCLDCGHEWLVYGSNISKGRKSCEPCARASSRVATEVWVQRLAEVHAVWVNGTPFNISDTSQLGKCLDCEGTWNVNPRRIWAGHPRCPSKVQAAILSEKTWIDRAKKVGVEWLEIPTRSKTRTPAKCLECGHEWKPIPDNIRSGSGCPKCALRKPKNLGGQKVSPEEWENRASKVGVRWKSGTPKSSKAKTPVTCLKCDYSWSPLAANIAKGSGCPRCAKNSPQPQSIWDERASAVGLKWLEPVKGRHSLTRVVCIHCGTKAIVEAGSVAGGTGCSKCGSKKAQLSRRLDQTVWIDRAAIQNLEWKETPSNNSEKKLIHCRICNYEWKVIPSTIYSGAGCPVCSGVVVEACTWEARAAAVNIRWLKIPASSRRPTPAQCLNCGLLWRPNPSGVTSGSGCPDCAETGYKVGQAGLLYLVERDSTRGRAARKIGITNVSSSKIRLNHWKKQGFELKFQKIHQNGQIILDLEQSLLRWLRHEQNLPQYLDKEEMPRGGATETFSPNEPSEFLLIEKIDSEFKRILRIHETP
jgi:predicted  nucleic acid-binding Zn-ribbon protein